MEVVLEVVEKSKSTFYKVNTPEIVIGRDGGSADITINDDGASKSHLRIEYVHGKWWAVDLESKNGTYINNSPIKRVQIFIDDIIQVGEAYIRFAASKMPLSTCQQLRRPGKKYTHNKSITLIQGKKQEKTQLFDGEHHGMKEITGIAGDIGVAKKDKILERRKKKKIVKKVKKKV